MKGKILNKGHTLKLGLAAVASSLIMGAFALPAQAADNVPPAEPQGCHGYWTVQYKKAVQDAGGQGSAIGGKGKSDGDPTNGQAHSAVGRGQTLQQFLAQQCGVGSAVN
jgi:uncharacterized membrane protein